MTPTYFITYIYIYFFGCWGEGYSNDNLNLISRLWIRKALYLLFLTRKMETLFCLFVSKREAMRGSSKFINNVGILCEQN